MFQGFYNEFTLRKTEQLAKANIAFLSKPVDQLDQQPEREDTVEALRQKRLESICQEGVMEQMALLTMGTPPIIAHLRKPTCHSDNMPP
ncbi:MAG TPA: hypothetical protein VE954_24640 [Oligoflexus sp.]|uniref:hypothetical protein n=1 Tax=Oligoflexus sp. TaxID=1971216 RepID=UPI002D334FBC|nr:hypothetical protein [Oligoflexus sp.]HYX36305.1 hypothetical protein [Oligoflexus sp.]